MSFIIIYLKITDKVIIDVLPFFQALLKYDHLLHIKNIYIKIFLKQFKVLI